MGGVGRGASEMGGVGRDAREMGGVGRHSMIIRDCIRQ
jgi:hypothetical protein